MGYDVLTFEDGVRELEWGALIRPWVKKNKVSHGTGGIHPAWIALIRHCQAMGHGEIERVKIQDGVPVLIEKSVERIKLT